MEETRKRKVSAGSLNQVKRHHSDTTISYNLCTKASPIDFHGVSLDDDALTEILARMPAKSLVRFKLVCKSWLSIISSDYFLRLHTLCKPLPSLILTTLNLGPSSSKQTIGISELSYDSNQGRYIKTSNEKQRIIPCDICVDNIFCVLCFNGIMLLINRRRECYVYNPATNHSEKIIIHGYNLDIWSLYLVFDPSKPPPHNYKIVCIRDIQLPILAFNSESRRWNVCDEGFTSGKSLMYVIRGGLLYCFNFNVKNVLQFIVCPLPKLADQGLVYYDILQESNGCLYYCAFVGNMSSKPAATLWELQVNEDRRSKWLLKYHHGVPRLPAICLHMLAFIRETSTILILDNGKIMAYSFVDTSYKELLHLEPFSTPMDYYIHANHFGETLP